MNGCLGLLLPVLPVLVMEVIQYIVVFMLAFLNQDQYLLSLAAEFVCGIIFYFWYRYETREDAKVGLRSVISVKNVLLLALLGIGSQFFVSGLMSFLQPLLSKEFENYTKVLESITSGNTFVVFLFMVIIAPIAEELVFRGVVLHMAHRSVPFLGANILQAVLFGIYHGNLIQGVYAAILGFLFGFIYHKYHSIFCTILLHIFVNASSYLVWCLPGNSWLVMLLITLVGGSFIGIALYGMKWFKATVQEA